MLEEKKAKIRPDRPANQSGLTVPPYLVQTILLSEVSRLHVSRFATGSPLRHSLWFSPHDSYIEHH